MANQLKMAEIQKILVLRSHGWSCRRIAKELGIHRETVARYIDLAATGGSGIDPAGDPAEAEVGPPGPGLAGLVPPKPANLPTGPESPKPANPPAGPAVSSARTSAGPVEPSPKVQDGAGGRLEGNSPSKWSGPPSQCEPYRQIVTAALEQGLTAQRIWQDLRAEQGFVGGYDSVKRFVRRLERSVPLPFRRMECDPGQEAQVDFGSGARVDRPEGGYRRTHVLRVLLSHSRKAYSEAVYRQTTDDFIRCLENAFWHFGGVPKTLVIDNLKAAVSRADWFDPELCPRVRSFAEHYGTVILPTKPKMPRHKGKAESGIGYVQSNGLRGRRFASLQAENQHLLEWETLVADTRIHGTTRRQVGKVFVEVERPALLPLPIQRFALFQEAPRKVHRDGHVEVARAYYSVPPQYLGLQVWARWDGRRVWILDESAGHAAPIAIHLQQEPGRFSTRPEHIASRKISGVERGSAGLLAKTQRIGPQATRWAQALLENRGIEGVRVLMGLDSLTSRYSCAQIDRACEIALTHGAYRLRVIRELIKRQGVRQQQFEFVQEHAIIRSLSEYESFVHACFRR